MKRNSYISNGLLLEGGKRTANTETAQFQDVYSDLRISSDS